MSEDTDKKSRRSPSHALAEAIGFLATVEKNLGGGPFNRASMSEALGHASESGPFSRKVGSLVHFGLLDRDGNTYRVSKAAKSILRPIDDGERGRVLEVLAKRPRLYAEIIQRYKGQPLPILLSNILVRDFNVHANSGTEAAKLFWETMEYAGLLRDNVLHEQREGSAISGGPPEDSTQKLNIGDLVQWISQGTARFSTPRAVRGFSDDNALAFVDGSTTGLPVRELKVESPTNGAQQNPDVGQLTDPPGSGSNLPKQETFVVSSGSVILRWPSELTSSDVQDIEDWIQIVLRKMKRAMTPE